MTKDAVKKPKRTGALRNERPKEVLLIRVKRFSKVADSKIVVWICISFESPI